MCCHSICTHFSDVSRYDPKIKSIEHEQQAKVHGGLRFDQQQNVEAKDGEHDDQVASDTCRVAQLVDQEEPLVHPSGNQHTLEIQLERNNFII